MKEKTIIAEWLKYMNAYRIYNVKRPQQTIAYDDDLDLKNTKEFAKHNGYTRIIILPNPKAARLVHRVDNGYTRIIILP